MSLPGYQPVTDAALSELAAAWARKAADQPSPSLPPQSSPGLTVTEMIDAAGAGRLRSLLILGEDPAMTDPDSNHTRRWLGACAFIVLQEIFPSETAAYADVLLPGASFAEKYGTFTNTERRIQLIRRAIDPPGEAWPDWRITSTLPAAADHSRSNARRPAGGLGLSIAERDHGRSRRRNALVCRREPRRLRAGERLQWPVRMTRTPARRSCMSVGSHAVRESST